MVKMPPIVRWAFNWKEWNPNEKDFLKCISCIQLEEKERLDRFVFRKDVRASLIGRLMMRKFVNEYGHIAYDKIVFVRDEHNKPVLQNPKIPLSFNISHQGDYTVLAGELKSMKLGVDVMKLEYTGGKSLSEFFRIMNRNFTSAEWQEIKGDEGATEYQQTAMFCRHWALKESFVKALGIGIVTDLKMIDFKTHTPLSCNAVVTDTVLYVNGVKQNWLFEESFLDKDYCIAVALEGDENSSERKKSLFKKIDYNKLMVQACPLFPEDKEYARRYFTKDETP